MAKLKENKNEAGAAVFNDTLVVCGGLDGNRNLCLWLSKAYDIDLNRWNRVSSLKQSRSGNKSATSGECLYTMGGWGEKNYLSSVEQLDRLDQSWKSVSSMQTARSALLL